MEQKTRKTGPPLILIICLFALTTGGGLSAQGRLPHRFRLPPDLNEVSGLYWAGPDSLWWHNDGGDAPRLYLTDRHGRIKKRVDLPGARNIDWEDLTHDKAGNLFIGDFGNNRNDRRDLCIYRYTPADGTLDSIRFYLADQRAFPPPPEAANFDIEAFFWQQDTLHLFSKNRLEKGNYFTKHYTLPAVPGVGVATLRDSLFLRRRVVTAAALSPDGRTVVLTAYHFKRFLGLIPTSGASLFSFRGFDGSDFFRGQVRRQALSFLVATQFESVDFADDRNVIVASEKTAFIRPRAKWKKVKGGKKRKAIRP